MLDKRCRTQSANKPGLIFDHAQVPINHHNNRAAKLLACTTNSCASACGNDKRMVPTVTATITWYLQAAAIAVPTAVENAHIAFYNSS